MGMFVNKTHHKSVHMSKQRHSIQTKIVKENERQVPTPPHQLPIFATSSFVYENVEQSIAVFEGKEQGHVYGRYGNPTIDTVAQKIADLEGYGLDKDTYGFLTSSGMSAISVLLTSLLTQGDEVLTQGNLYGGTTELLRSILSKQGIKTHFIDCTDLDLVKQTLDANPSIKLIYLETPSNPTLDCVDLSALAQIAKDSDILTMIDNTFCTPYLQQPLAHGIDFVIHSTTKYLNGHGNSIAGAIVGHRQDLRADIWKTLKLTGATCNSWDAWLTNNGMKTLAVRMDRHCDNAMSLASFLEQHSAVSRVNYNGLPSHPYHEVASKQMKAFGGMLSFDIQGSVEDCFKVMDSLQITTQAPTLGDVDTLLLHPASSSHLNVPQQLRLANGITDTMIRVSVGIEDIEDLIQDFGKALSGIK